MMKTFYPAGSFVFVTLFELFLTEIPGILRCGQPDTDPMMSLPPSPRLFAAAIVAFAFVRVTVEPPVAGAWGNEGHCMITGWR
jgi:hypothetical protein